MTDTISTFLLYDREPPNLLSDLYRAARNDGWRLPTREGESECIIDGEVKTYASGDDFVTDVDTAKQASIPLQKGGPKVYLVKEDDLLPDGTAPCLYLWSDKYEGYLYQSDSRSRDEAQANLELYLDLVELAVERTEPYWGFGKRGKAVASDWIHTIDDASNGRIHNVFWLNIFDPETVDAIGYKRLAASPAWRVTELGTGHVLLVTMDNPFEPSGEWVGAADRVTAHLGLDT